MNIQINKPAGDSGLIMVFDGLIDPKICSQFIIKLQNFWHKCIEGETLGGVNYTVKTTEDLHVSQYAFIEKNLQWDSELSDIDMSIISGLQSAVAIYKQNYRHLDHWIQIQDTGFQVQKYYKNYGYYRPHVDSFPGSTVDNRVLAVVVYLNDVEYGGETNFPIHHVMIKPKAGRIALFPAVWTHLHESCVPISSDKWIVSTFILNKDIDTPQEIQNELHIQDLDHIHDQNTHVHSHENNHIDNPIISNINDF